MKRQPACSLCSMRCSGLRILRYKESEEKHTALSSLLEKRSTKPHEARRFTNVHDTRLKQSVGEMIFSALTLQTLRRDGIARPLAAIKCETTQPARLSGRKHKAQGEAKRNPG